MDNGLTRQIKAIEMTDKKRRRGDIPAVADGAGGYQQGYKQFAAFSAKKLPSHLRTYAQFTGRANRRAAIFQARRHHRAAAAGGGRASILAAAT